MEHIHCESCPCWRQYWEDDEFTKPVYERKIRDGQPLLDSNGDQIRRKGPTGRWLLWGACGAKLPEFGSNGQIQVSMRSDWWCESKEKHEAIARLGLVELKSAIPKENLTRPNKSNGTRDRRPHY